MAIDYTALGQRVADFRSKENLSQEELAFSCGVGSKHISNIELGKSKPSLESLIQIANFLNVSADDLTGGNRDFTDVLTHKGHFTGKVVHDGT